MQLKSHESPRSMGKRNKKGAGGSARSKQLQKMYKRLKKKLS